MKARRPGGCVALLRCVLRYPYPRRGKQQYIKPAAQAVRTNLSPGLLQRLGVWWGCADKSTSSFAAFFDITCDQHACTCLGCQASNTATHLLSRTGSQAACINIHSATSSLDDHLYTQPRATQLSRAEV